MTPKQQGKAQAQRNIERLVADALEGCGYEGERPGVRDEGGVDPLPSLTMDIIWGWDIILSEGKWDWNFMAIWAFVCWGTAGGLFIANGFSIWPFINIAAGFWALHLSENGVFERLWQRLRRKHAN